VSAFFIEVGRGDIDATLINNGGTINGGRLWAGGENGSGTGKAQFRGEDSMESYGSIFKIEYER